MSEIRANTISDAAGTGPVTLTGQSAAKAWVNFNGTGTVAVREDFNVSSITDNGTGNYTVNFSTAMADTNYAPVVTASSDGRGFLTVTAVHERSGSAIAPTTSAFRVYLRTSGTNTDVDSNYVNAIVTR